MDARVLSGFSFNSHVRAGYIQTPFNESLAHAKVISGGTHEPTTSHNQEYRLLRHKQYSGKPLRLSLYDGIPVPATTPVERW